MSSDSDAGIFLTQSQFRESPKQNVDTDGILSDILNMEKANQAPDFSLKSDIFSDISEDEMGNITQEMEKVEKEMVTKRFAEPLKEGELQNIQKSALCANTENKTKWAVRTFENWQKERERVAESTENIRIFGTNIFEYTSMELNDALSYFVTEVRNQSGGEYRPNTVYELVIAIQHHLRGNGQFINILDDKEFTGLRQILDSKMKILSKRGLGIQTRQAEVIGENQETEMWEKGILGTNTPQKLVDTVLYLLGLNFALRAGQEHRNLRHGKLGQIREKNDSEGHVYLEYTEDVSKTNPGGILHRKVKAKTTQAYRNVINTDRCPVEIYQKYISLRPSNGKCEALYLRPKKIPTVDVWYSDSPIGVHQLQQTVARLCKSAGLSGFYTNHSLRATAATRLYNAGVDEQLVVEKTGHRSTAVRSYKRTNEEQKQNVSNVIQGNKKTKIATATSSSTMESDVDASDGREIRVSSGNMSFVLKF